MGKRLLLIDDDDLLCEVLSDFLALSGYVVTRAANGREGLERLANSAPFDLVILDLLMPEIDGMRFLALATEGERRLPPVLVISASASARIVDSLDFACVAGIERKPIKPQTLLDRVAALIGKD